MKRHLRWLAPLAFGVVVVVVLLDAVYDLRSCARASKAEEAKVAARRAKLPAADAALVKEAAALAEHERSGRPPALPLLPAPLTRPGPGLSLLTHARGVRPSWTGTKIICFAADGNTPVATLTVEDLAGGRWVVKAR